MEQIQKLMEILSETPQMALWGLSIYFLFILLKIASWVGSLTLVLKLAITKYFEHKDAKLGIDKMKLKQNDAHRLLKHWKDSTVNLDSDKLLELIQAMKTENRTYIYKSDFEEAIKAIRDHKEAKNKS